MRLQGMGARSLRVTIFNILTTCSPGRPSGNSGRPIGTYCSVVGPAGWIYEEPGVSAM